MLSAKIFSVVAELCTLGIPVDVLSLGLLCLAILEIDDPRIMEEEPELVDCKDYLLGNKCATLMKTGKLDSSLSYKIDELENEIGQGIRSSGKYISGSNAQ